MAGRSWLDNLVPLKRPEYAKQTEALLTDLLWRSSGSSHFAGSSAGRASHFEALQARSRIADHAPLERLVPRKTRTGSKKLTETFPLAAKVELDTLLRADGVNLELVEALLESITAPRSRGIRSIACVPVYLDALVFQTLHGLVNKQNPANVADIIETVGWLGGAGARGDVARAYLVAAGQAANERLGRSPVEEMIARLAGTVWESLGALSEGEGRHETWPEWSSPSAVEESQSSLAKGLLEESPLKRCRTPFSWFWEKWSTLCDVEAGWYEVLPPRRFIDWALCLLRTGLAFAYLWEADFYLRLHACAADRAAGRAVEPSLRSMRSFLVEGPILAKLEPRTVPAVQKDIWPGIRTHLARGYVARERLQSLAAKSTYAPSWDEGDVFEVLREWVEHTARGGLEDYEQNLETEARTAKNQREFVRYLLQQRSAEDDSRDQTDLYYLLERNSQSTWFDPGPEWIVVNASLLCRKPSSNCTLGQVIRDLSQLGIQVERSVVTRLLEEAGMSTDSPDADEALVVYSGF